mgnify:CR=1 FL=1
MFKKLLKIPYEIYIENILSFPQDILIFLQYHNIAPNLRNTVISYGRKDLNNK